MSSKRNASRPREKPWAGLDDAALLNLRFCDLRLSLADSPAAADVDDLYRTLERRGIRFRPHVWLSTEWFSPDGIPGIALPFYLAHPRLVRLERRLRGEAEGASRGSRRQILRHEAGHALDTAYGLRRRADWRAVFGHASRPYPHCYSARPASRRFVQHLHHWYAQSHPTEDFAETFAVWLQPRTRWRREYADWPALRKLEYVDSLMDEIVGRRPSKVDRSTAAAIAHNRRRLREHYRRSFAFADLSDRRYDTLLYRVFVPRPAEPRASSATAFLDGIARDLSLALERRSAGHYLAEHVIATLRRRARELDLVIIGSKRDVRRRAIQLHERVLADILRRNRERYML